MRLIEDDFNSMLGWNNLRYFNIFYYNLGVDPRQFLVVALRLVQYC